MQHMVFRAMRRLACAAATVCCLTTAHATSPDGSLGARIATTCVACHRIDGHPDGMPPIDGLATGTLINMMKIARSNARVSPIMRTVSLSLSDEELAAVAVYLANVRRGADPP